MSQWQIIILDNYLTVLKNSDSQLLWARAVESVLSGDIMLWIWHVHTFKVLYLIHIH